MNCPDGYILRSASNRDTDAIKELIFTILCDYGLSPDPESTDMDLSDIEKNYLENGGTFDVLIDTSSQKIIGTVGLWPIDEESVELRKMYLNKMYRGFGLGRLLIDHAIDTVRKQKYKRIVLETASVLKEAIALYTRYGFKTCKPSHLAARCDTAMELDLEGDTIL